MTSDQQADRKKLLDEHVASVDALHRKLREKTDEKHHARLSESIEGVKKAVRAVGDDDDAFGSLGHATT